MAHWRSMFESAEFMTAADLYDAKSDKFLEVTAEISRIEKITLTGKKGKKDGRPGVWFKGQKTSKPLGLNATNCGAIENVTGTSDMKKWIGAVVTLKVEIVEIRGEGRRPAIRISPFRPDQQRAANVTSTKVPANYQPGDELLAPVDDEEAELARHAAEQERKS